MNEERLLEQALGGGGGEGGLQEAGAPKGAEQPHSGN